MHVASYSGEKLLNGTLNIFLPEDVGLLLVGLRC